VRIEYLLDLLGNGFALLEDGFQAVGQPWEHCVRGCGAWDGDGLFVQRGHDRVDQLVAHAGRVDLCDRGEFASAAAGEDLQHGRVADLGTNGSFQAGMDAGEQAADAVGDPGGLTGRVVVADIGRAQVWGRDRAASATT